MIRNSTIGCYYIEVKCAPQNSHLTSAKLSSASDTGMKYFLITMILVLSLGGCGGSAPPQPPANQDMAEFRQAQQECIQFASSIYPPLMRSNGPGFETDLNDVPRLKAVNECLYAKGYN